MRLINRSRKDSPLARRACDAALTRHVERFSDYASRASSSEYMVLVDGMKMKVCRNQLETIRKEFGNIALVQLPQKTLPNSLKHTLPAIKKAWLQD